MKRLRLLKLLLGLVPLLGLAAPVRAQVSIGHVAVANVTTSSATLVWKVSGDSFPGLDVFSDAAGTVSLAGQVGVEFFPVAKGEFGVGGGPDERVARRTLQASIGAKRNVMVRLSGLAPATSYYVRPRTYTTSGGPDNGTGPLPLVHVRTSAATSFVRDARILELDLSDASEIAGLIVLLQGPAGTGSLAAVVGEGEDPSKAVFNLADLVDTVLQTNASLEGERVFSAVMYDDSPTPLEPQDFAITFSAATVVADTDRGTYEMVAPTAFAIDTIPDQRAGLAFSITIRALRDGGQQLTTYNGRVTVSGVDFGGGTTATFDGGVLKHAVMISTAGSKTVTVARSGLTATSNAFTVKETFGSWKSRFFSGADRTNPEVSGPAADPGGYGVPNVLRYAFGTGVNPPARARMPAYGFTEVSGLNYLSVSFPRSPAAEDVEYRVEASGDLVAWDLVETVRPGTPEWVSVRDTVAITAGQRRFMRVSVQQQTTFGDYANDLFSDALKQDPTATDPFDDYGGRGIPNLLRYAFAMNFENPTVGQLPVVSTSSEGGVTRLSITFRRRTSAGENLRYLVQAGTLMGAWTTIQTVYPGTPEYVTVYDTQPIGGTPRAMRVVVEQD